MMMRGAELLPRRHRVVGYRGFRASVPGGGRLLYMVHGGRGLTGAGRTGRFVSRVMTIVVVVMMMVVTVVMMVVMVIQKTRLATVR